MLDTQVTMTIYADPDYYFEVNEYDIKYVEGDRQTIEIGFGTNEEVEAVANAMLTIVRMQKEK